MNELVRRAVRRYREDGATATASSTIGYLHRHVLLNYFRLKQRTPGPTVTMHGVDLDLRGIRLSTVIERNILHGRYEEAERMAIAKHLEPDMDIIDLGAGLGITACYANQRQADDRAHVVVEANSELIPILERNRSLNDCDFEILHAAYASEGETVKLRIPEKINSSSIKRSEGRAETVPTVGLQKIITEYGLEDIALIADIEGAEADLFESELDVIEDNCRLLIIEFHDHKQRYDTERIRAVRDRLEATAFKCVDSTDEVRVYRQ